MSYSHPGFLFHNYKEQDRSGFSILFDGQPPITVLFKLFFFPKATVAVELQA